MNHFTKKVHIKTYGCQMNIYDSDRMADIMKVSGYTLTDSIADSDLVIINTCHIREKAAEKIYSELGRLRQIKDKRKKNGKSMIIAIAGCVAQAEGEKILKRAPYVDVIVGPQAYQRLPEMIANAEKSSVIDLDFSVNEKFDLLPQSTENKRLSAFLTVQEGCNKFCTYCVVPYTRGAEFSRHANGIYEEAKRLVDNGVMEITLLGQNVNAYVGTHTKKTKEKHTHKSSIKFHSIKENKVTLGKLIENLAELDGLKRIRYTTSHPCDMDDDLITAHANIEKLMPFIHLPVQSGSDKILKLMNRKHTVDFYKKLIDKIREARSDIAFSSDFIVGFPGETDKDFEDTLHLVKDIGYAQCFSFKYSPRLGTPAALKTDIVPEKVKSERLTELQTLLEKQQMAYNKSMVEKTIPVLFDRKGKYEGQIVGISPYVQPVRVNADDNCIGKIIDVKIEEGFAKGLGGVI